MKLISSSSVSDRPRNPPSCHRGSNGWNLPPTPMGARPFCQPWKRRCGPASQERRQPRQNPSFPPASHERESAHSSEDLRSVGARMEIVHQGRSLTKGQQRTTSWLHEEIIREPAEEPRIPPDVATYALAITGYPATARRLATVTMTCAYAARKKQSPTCWWTARG